MGVDGDGRAFGEHGVGWWAGGEVGPLRAVELGEVEVERWCGGVVDAPRGVVDVVGEGLAAVVCAEAPGVFFEVVFEGVGCGGVEGPGGGDGEVVGAFADGAEGVDDGEAGGCGG